MTYEIWHIFFVNFNNTNSRRYARYFCIYITYLYLHENIYIFFKNPDVLSMIPVWNLHLLINFTFFIHWLSMSLDTKCCGNLMEGYNVIWHFFITIFKESNKTSLKDSNKKIFRKNVIWISLSFFVRKRNWYVWLHQGRK